MKKSVLVCLALIMLVLSACSPDYSYSNTEDSYDEIDINDFNLFKKKFVSEYYRKLGKRGGEADHAKQSGNLSPYDERTAFVC